MARALVCSSTLVACIADAGEPPDSGADFDADGFGSPAAEPEDDDDDDEQGEQDDDERRDPPDPPPACDLDALAELELDWVVEVTSPTAGATPSVSAILVTDTGLYAAGRHDIGSSEPLGYLERRTLAGQRVWQVELDRARGPFALRWDGAHVYAASGHRVGRWTADGHADAWAYEAEFIADIAVDEDELAVVGTETEAWGHVELADAYFGTLSKGSPTHFAGSSHAIAERSDHGEAVVASPWGGRGGGDDWIAAGYVAQPPHTWLRGYTSELQAPGSGFAAQFELGVRTSVAALSPGEDALLAWIRDASGRGPWLVAFGPGGDERWRERLRPCGDASVSLARVVADPAADPGPGPARFWALAEVQTVDGGFAPLLFAVELGPAPNWARNWAPHGAPDRTGAVTITEVAALAPERRPVALNAIAAADGEVYLGGFDRRSDRRVRVIGRVRSAP